MIQYRAECVFAVRRHLGQFHGFGYGRPQGALMIRILRQDILACPCGHGRGRNYLCSEYLHDTASVWLLLVADFHLIDGRFQSEQSGCVCQGRSPLSCSCLSSHVGSAFLLAIVGLGQGGIKFVRTYRAYAFVLEVYMGRCPYRFFKSVCTDKRGRAIVCVHFTHFVGYVDPSVGLVELLSAEFFGKQGIEILDLQRLSCGRIQKRHRFVLHVCLDVVPLSRQFRFGQEKSFLFHFAVILSLFYINVDTQWDFCRWWPPFPYFPVSGCLRMKKEPVENVSAGSFKSFSVFIVMLPLCRR